MDLPIARQTLLDLNDEVELNALLGVEDYMGMEDVEDEDNEDEEDVDYDSDSSNESAVPGVRKSVGVAVDSSPTIPEKTREALIEGI